MWLSHLQTTIILNHLQKHWDFFADHDELKSAVDESCWYIDMYCGTDQSACKLVSQKYGWPINLWCLGNVTDLFALFNLIQSFSKDIGAWDVSRVTNTSNLFNFSTSFNRDLSSWDVSNVKNCMHGMCKSCVLDGYLVWDDPWIAWLLDIIAQFISSIISPKSCLCCILQWKSVNILGWCISHHEHAQYYVLLYAIAFNGDLSNWDVSSVGDMSNIFEWATSFNHPLLSWNITMQRTCKAWCSAIQHYSPIKTSVLGRQIFILWCWQYFCGIRLYLSRRSIREGQQGRPFCASSCWFSNIIINARSWFISSYLFVLSTDT